MFVRVANLHGFRPEEAPRTSCCVHPAIVIAQEREKKKKKASESFNFHGSKYFCLYVKVVKLSTQGMV